MHFDLIIIGAGSGGMRAARKAAALGKKVALVEASNLGGTCINLGCIPKKVMTYSAQMHKVLSNAYKFGWHFTNLKFHWHQMVAYRNQEIIRLQSVYSKSLLNFPNITLIKAKARFVNNHTITWQGSAECVSHSKLEITPCISADKILIATGSRSKMLDIPGKEYCLLSNDIFALPQLPESIIIVGGGYIAMEFASILHAFGSSVTVVHHNSQVLRLFDVDTTQHLVQEMQKQGIKFLFDSWVKSINKVGQQLRCILHNNLELVSDYVLCTVGRIPNIESLSLHCTDVKLTADNKIQVNEFTQTSVACIHAIGDVTGNIGLAPLAISEAQAFINNVYLDLPTHTNYDNVPMAVFTNPGLAKVGHSEYEASSRFGSENIKVISSKFTPLIERFREVSDVNLIKIIIHQGTGRIIGFHMVGELASELAQTVAICIQSGLSYHDFADTIALHPTVAEEIVLMMK